MDEKDFVRRVVNFHTARATVDSAFTLFQLVPHFPKTVRFQHLDGDEEMTRELIAVLRRLATTSTEFADALAAILKEGEEGE